MISIISSYPFLLALIGAMVVELSAIMVRRAAHVLGGWAWMLAGILSSTGVAVLTWSFFWAISSGAPAGTAPAVPAVILGWLLILIGTVWLTQSLLSLGRQAWFPWPVTRLIDDGLYGSRRRPMVAGTALVAVGSALTTNRIEGWIWLAVWFVLAQPLLELEEQELRVRFPGAAAYLARTPRYFRWLKRRS